jgi:ABC-type transport system involved in cytochrome bd biosynthesis fused ATPase/permease subunit
VDFWSTVDTAVASDIIWQGVMASWAYRIDVGDIAIEREFYRPCVMSQAKIDLVKIGKNAANISLESLSRTIAGMKVIRKLEAHVSYRNAAPLMRSQWNVREVTLHLQCWSDAVESHIAAHVIVNKMLRKLSLHVAEGAADVPISSMALLKAFASMDSALVKLELIDPFNLI